MWKWAKPDLSGLGNEWFNQICLFTIHCHHPGEASWQNREKVTEQILNK